ncbi:MAG TPA: peptidoglycan DD-metalloendopeptidase family protein [Pyrinomonadaceae bacterium]|jgi:murein DD-endopeptidase MepM/ murein hydrolase activator NlpD|nr:peptidoglycan DD-metalloendopeptidase family protein [Pyrinomonadaceae bacterium]
MMVRDERFYAFIISYTSRSRSRIRRICFNKKWLKLSGAFAFLVLASSIYGFYGLTQQAAHLRIEHENERLRAETERQRQELNQLNERVQAVEDTSRKLAEKSGVVDNPDSTLHGAGGPAVPLDAAGLAALETKMSKLESELKAHEAVLRERGFTPSIWPVDGKLESGFGGRRNPFGGSSYEFHQGQDIDAQSGTPIVAGAKGTVTFVGWQHGYGRLIVIDHGGGLTTRYGHLSEFDIEQGTPVARGQFIGRVGSTGRSTGPHLHYEIRINDDPVNPLEYLLNSSKQ